jgi:hypothetical protein
MKINIVLIEPPNHNHSAVFEELIVFFFDCFKDLGHEVIRTVNVFKQDHLNIIIANQYLHFSPVFKNMKYIIVQLEQLSFEGGWFSFDYNKPKFSTDFIPLLENAAQIWDYSKENINFLNNYKLDVKLISLGYDPNLQTIKHAEEKDIDVLFYGSTQERRFNVIKSLEKLCKITGVFGKYGKERDSLIARSKIVLNIHAYGNINILEQVRVFYLLTNKCFVLSEECSWNPYEDALVTTPYDLLIEKTLYWLKNNQEREIMANKGLEKIKNIDTKELIKTALEEL